MYRLRLPLDIVYFPKNPMNFREMWETAEILFKALETLELPDGSGVRGRGERFEFCDGALHFYVTYELRVCEADDGGGDDSLMGELVHNYDI